MDSPKILDTATWLQIPPLPEEIKVKDGGKYIPYRIIVEKLNQLCGHNWGIPQFQETYVTLGKRLLVTGNVIVEVNYMVDGVMVNRKLAGAANFMVTKQSNPHCSATVKSLAVLNSIKPLGAAFGWGLNPENEEEKATFSNPIIPDEKSIDKEKERIFLLISQCETLDDLLSFKIMAETKKLHKEFATKLRFLTEKLQNEPS